MSPNSQTVSLDRASVSRAQFLARGVGSHSRCPIGHSVDIANENWTSGCRAATGRWQGSVVNLSPALRHFGSQVSWDSFESDSLCRGGSAQPTCVAVHRTAEQRGVAGPSSYITTTHLIGLVFCKMTTAQRSQDRRAGAARSRKPNDDLTSGLVRSIGPPNRRGDGARRVPTYPTASLAACGAIRGGQRLGRKRRTWAGGRAGERRAQLW
jgi:hypothetical protein